MLSGWTIKQRFGVCGPRVPAVKLCVSAKTSHLGFHIPLLNRFPQQLVVAIPDGRGETHTGGTVRWEANRSALQERGHCRGGASASKHRGGSRSGCSRRPPLFLDGLRRGTEPH